MAVEVANLAQRESQLVGELDKMILDSQQELSSLTLAWVNAQVPREIDSHPDVVQALGVEKLRDIKSKVRDLTARLPNIVEDLLKQKSSWPHHRHVDDERYAHSLSPDELLFFDRIFRDAVGRLGEILHKYGLTSSPKGHRASWESAGAGRFRYLKSTGFETSKTQTLNRYADGVVELKRLRITLKQKRESVESAKARELWDSA